MSKVKNSLVLFAGLSLVIGLIGLRTPARTQGQGEGNEHPLNVNVVNTRTVKTTDFSPAQPFQRELIFTTATPAPVCVSVPAGRGLIIELVTARTFSTSNPLGHFVLGMRTTAGGESMFHNIPLQRQENDTNGAQFFIAQPLRAY